MIKKFKEYNENKLTREDIEDQFLRLKEVYDCTIIIYTSNKRIIVNSQFVADRGSNQYTKEEMEPVLNNIKKELLNIKNRIQNMHPELHVKIHPSFISKGFVIGWEITLSNLL